MDTKKFPYWLAVEESKLVKFADLAHMMAKAIHPREDEGIAYGFARINLEKELPEAVHNGDLVVRNSSGMGKHEFPYGDALQRAVMLPLELRPFLETRGIELRLMPHGSGPSLWTLENAASAIAEQEDWHNGARGRLLDEMMEAAIKRELIVRDPHTNLPKATGEIREYYELVTPADVNAWLENNSAPYRWNITMPVENAGPYEQWELLVKETDDVRNEPAYKAEYDRHCRLLEEQSQLQCKERQNFPYIDVEIKKRLSQIEYELRTPEVVEAPVSTPQTAPAIRLVPPASESVRNGLTTAQIVEAFDDLVTFNLGKSMTDKAMWTHDARITSGTRGGRYKSLWDPVIMATAIRERNNVPMPKLNQAFNSYPFLADWREDWNRYSKM